MMLPRIEKYYKRCNHDGRKCYLSLEFLIYERRNNYKRNKKIFKP